MEVERTVKLEEAWEHEVSEQDDLFQELEEVPVKQELVEIPVKVEVQPFEEFLIKEEVHEVPMEEEHPSFEDQEDKETLGNFIIGDRLGSGSTNETVESGKQRPFHQGYSSDFQNSHKYCGKLFQVDSYRTHTEEKPVICSTCNKSFRIKSQLTQHLITHTGYRPFPCSACTKTFKRKGDLKSHLRTHSVNNFIRSFFGS